MALVKKLIILIFIFFFVDFLISLPLSEFSKNSKIRYSRLYNESINADVIFIGNSRGVNAFYSPYFDRFTGLTSINFSYNGLTIPVIKILLDDYLLRNSTPKLLFIEITCLSNTYEILPNFKQYMGSSSPIKNSIKQHYPKIFYASLFSRSFRYNSEYFLRTLYYLKKDDQSWINRYHIKKDYYDKMKPGKNSKIFREINFDALKIFALMVDEYRKKGIVIIPVVAPILDKSRNETSIKNYISNISTNAKIDIVDLSDAISDISMFADTIHTNEKGAILIVNKLYQQLQTKNLTKIFNDKR